MSNELFPVPANIAKSALIDAAKYKSMYDRSVADPAGFWGEAGKRIDWIKPYTKVKNTSFTGDVPIKWYEDGTLNVSANCLDRHLAKRGDQIAIIWEGDDPNEHKHITYRQAYEETCRMANVLKKHGVKKGDRVTIYLPMIPEAAYAMLACARIGAIHSVVFGGFSPESLRDRLDDAQAKVLVTADGGYRRGQVVPLKRNADRALEAAPSVQHCVVVRRLPAGAADESFAEMRDGRDHWYHRLMQHADPHCDAAVMDAEDE
ncbi:MAG: AMP-binding protein, partial [Rhodospirillales bacterium]